MNLKNAKYLDIVSDIVVIGYNSENADCENPRGAIHGYCVYVTVTCPLGYRWAHQWTSTGRWEDEQVARAKVLLARIQAALDEGKDLDPNCWSSIDPAYGSTAYCNEGIEEERNLIERAEALAS